MLYQKYELIDTNYHRKYWVDWRSARRDKISQTQKCIFWEKLEMSMIYAKIWWNIFKMQTFNHNFRKNVATDKKHFLRKMRLKFQNPRFNISCR